MAQISLSHHFCSVESKHPFRTGIDVGLKVYIQDQSVNTNTNTMCVVRILNIMDILGILNNSVIVRVSVVSFF